MYFLTQNANLSHFCDFWKGFKWGKVGGHFHSNNLCCRFWTFQQDMKLKKRLQDHFTKMRGEGEKPFRTFPKIHPFWWRLVLSLKRLWKYRCSAPQKFKATNASSAALVQLGRVSLIFSPLKSVDPDLKTQISDTIHALKRGCISPNIKVSSSVLIPVCFCCLLTNWVDHWILQGSKDVNEE